MNTDTYPEGMTLTKPCKCGKRMIVELYPRQQTSVEVTTRWKCYGCGDWEDGPTLRNKSLEELQRDRWKHANEG